MMSNKYSKVFRRFIMLILCFAMTASCITVCEAAASKTIASKINFLKFMGIINDDMDAETANTDSVVSRAEYAQYLIKFLNIPVSSSGNLYYNDIPKTHYAYDEITSLTDAGYLSGTGSKTFNPEAPMKTKYVYITIAKALGFGPVIEKSADAAGYAEMICSSKGILSGAENVGSDLNLDTYFNIMYNALLTKVYTFNSSFDEIVEGEETLLYTTRKMRYVKHGCVTAVGNVDIYGKNTLKDIMIIDNTEYDLPDFDAADYLGRQVRFVYKEDRHSFDTEKKIIWMETSDDDSILEISVGSDKTYNSETNVLSYETENEKTKTVKIPESIIMIYNGKFQQSNIKEILSHDRLKMRFLTMGDSDYKIVVAEEYYNIVVNYKNINDKIVFGQNGESLSLDESEYDDLIFCNASGSHADIAALQTNNVISVYKSYDGKKVKAVVSAASVNGTVKSVNEDTFEIDDEEYEFYNLGENANEFVAENVTIYLDINGFVAYCIKTDSSNSFVGYLIKGGVDSGKGGETLRLKILKEDGKIEYFDVADKVVINDKTYRNNPTEAIKSLSESGAGQRAKPQIIKIGVNLDNKIRKISTAFEDDGKTHELTVNKRLAARAGDASNSAFSYLASDAKRIGREMAYGPNTKIFTVPEDAFIDDAKDSQFRVGNPLEGDSPNAVSYRTKATADFFEEYIVIKRGGNTNELSKIPVMFDKMFPFYDGDGNVLNKVIFYNKFGSKLELEVDEDFDFKSYGLMRGDILNYATSDLNGRVTNISVVYQPSKNIVTSNINDTTSEYRTVVGYVNNVYPEGITIGYESGANNDEVTYIGENGANNVVIYDRDSDKIIIGDYSSVRPYKTYGSECSAAIIFNNYSKFNGMYIYR